MVACYDQPLGEANSVFISAHPADDRSRAPQGQRAITVSTHTNAECWWRWRKEDPARYRAEKAAMAERMLDTVTLAMTHDVPWISVAAGSPGMLETGAPATVMAPVSVLAWLGAYR